MLQALDIFKYYHLSYIFTRYKIRKKRSKIMLLLMDMTCVQWLVLLDMLRDECVKSQICVRITICPIELATGHGSHSLLIDTLMASIEAIVIDLSTPNYMDNNMEKKKRLGACQKLEQQINKQLFTIFLFSLLFIPFLNSLFLNHFPIPNRWPHFISSLHFDTFTDLPHFLIFLLVSTT